MQEAAAAVATSGTRRKSENRQRQRVRHFRFDSAEDAALEAAAAEAGLSVTAYVRQRTIGSAGVRSLRKRIDLAELARLLGETGKIGSNVNQIARVANANGDLPTVSRLDEIWQELSQMRAALMRALGRGD
jgi:hypothetical protein